MTAVLAILIETGIVFSIALWAALRGIKTRAEIQRTKLIEKQMEQLTQESMEQVVRLHEGIADFKRRINNEDRNRISRSAMDMASSGTSNKN